uniref:Uncharacterized protein n=1 Tax=Oscillatoriales cyanobacterium SpSt-402 TaxID=2282168 RepID=A0A832H864_9CYAN
MSTPVKAQVLQQELQEAPSQRENAQSVQQGEAQQSPLRVENQAEIEPEGEPEPPEAIVSTGLEAKIDRLVDVMTQFIQVQLQSGSVPKLAVPKPVASRVAQPQEQEASDTVNQPQPERKRRRSSETEEIIHHAIDAIMQHNNQAARHDDKWAITINALKAFAKSQRKIELILQNRKEEIKHHHQKHQIDPERHNLKHRGKHKIDEVIRL